MNSLFLWEKNQTWQLPRKSLLGWAIAALHIVVKSGWLTLIGMLQLGIEASHDISLENIVM